MAQQGEGREGALREESELLSLSTWNRCGSSGKKVRWEVGDGG